MNTALLTTGAAGTASPAVRSRPVAAGCGASRDVARVSARDDVSTPPPQVAGRPDRPLRKLLLRSVTNLLPPRPASQASGTGAPGTPLGAGTADNLR